MKRTLLSIPLVLAGIFWGCSSDSYDDTELWNKVNSLDSRVSAIEATLARMNTDINSISVLVNAMRTNVYVTNVQETYIGYVITFSDNRVITIQNGKDGKDGQTPYIGTNGNWWFGNTDTNISAIGHDGRDGRDGTDGRDGFTPYIGTNGNWWINNEDTGVKAS